MRNLYWMKSFQGRETKIAFSHYSGRDMTNIWGRIGSQSELQAYREKGKRDERCKWPRYSK